MASIGNGDADAPPMVLRRSDWSTALQPGAAISVVLADYSKHAGIVFCHDPAASCLAVETLSVGSKAFSLFPTNNVKTVTLYPSSSSPSSSSTSASLSSEDAWDSPASYTSPQKTTSDVATGGASSSVSSPSQAFNNPYATLPPINKQAIVAKEAAAMEHRLEEAAKIGTTSYSTFT